MLWALPKSLIRKATELQDQRGWVWLGKHQEPRLIPAPSHYVKGSFSLRAFRELARRNPELHGAIAESGCFGVFRWIWSLYEWVQAHKLLAGIED